MFLHCERESFYYYFFSGVPKRRSMEVSGRRPVAALSNSDHSNSSDSNPGGERKPVSKFDILLNHLFSPPFNFN